MAGNGPPPTGRAVRRNRSEPRSIVRSDGRLGGHPLPEGVLGTDSTGTAIDWHPQTVQWWDHWRSSPQATRMLTDVDWDYLLDTALLHHGMWTSGGRNTERSAEIRIRVAQFGATPADRARLRFEIEIEIPEAFPAGNAPDNDPAQARLEARRDRYAGNVTPLHPNP